VRVAYTLEQCWHRVPGGTAVAALALARALVQRPDIELVGVAARHRTPPPSEWRPPVAGHALPLPRLALYESWHLLRRPFVERATGPVDVIHATGIAMPPASRPIVLTVHDLAYLDYPQMFTRAGLRFFERAFELALADATMVLCSSLATLARCREAGFDDARLRHVPLGVEITPVSEAVVAEALARFGLRRGYVLWTGTVEPRKNLPTLLRAFAAMEGLVDLVLVGPPGWNEDLESILGALPRGVQERVKRLGWVPRDDLAALYAGAGVFCFPSLLEGFGDHVMDEVGKDLVPGVERISARFHGRRVSRTPFEKAMLRITGMDLKMEQYRKGEVFVAEIERLAGAAALRRLWDGPETLPKPAEIDRPADWVQRMGLNQLTGGKS